MLCTRFTYNHLFSPPNKQILYESLPAIGVQQQAIRAVSAGDVCAIEGDKPTGTSTAIEQSPPTQRASWESSEELQKNTDPTCSLPPTLTAQAVSHVFLSPEQHSDSSFDDPAIIQKVPTVAPPAEQRRCTASTGSVHTELPTTPADAVPIARIEDQLLELFPSAEDVLPPPDYVHLSDSHLDVPPEDSPRAVPPSSSVPSVSDVVQQERSPTFTLGSPTSHSGDYFPSGYLNSEAEEQDGVPLLISTFDEQYPKDTNLSLPPVVEELPPSSSNPPLGLSMSSPLIAVSCIPHDNTATHYNEGAVSGDPAVLGPDLVDDLSSVCSEGLEPLTTYPPACSIATGGSHTAESGGDGEAGDLGFLRECFPDLDANYLEQLYHHCGEDVEAAVSRALLGYSYPHAGNEVGTEETNSNISSSGFTREHAPWVQADDDVTQDTKNINQQVLAYLHGDLEGMTFGQLGREQFNVTETDVHPDCVDDEEIARQLQQELNLELQNSPPRHSPGPPPQPPPEEQRTPPAKEGEIPESDDNLVLKLTPSLAHQLQEMFGSVTELLPFPGECLWCYVHV